MADPVFPPPDMPPGPDPIARWIRQASREDDAGAALFSAGAALAMLDPCARSADPVGQLWRRRLALSAAAATCKLEGRREDAARIRDHWAFHRDADDPGPAGRRLAAWRLLGEPRGLKPADWAARLPVLFDLAPDAALLTALRDAGARLPGAALPVRAAAGAAESVLRLGPAHRGLALWLADAVLARGLGWDRGVPLLVTHLPRAAFGRANAERAQDWLAACATAWAQAAVAAAGLHADLTRRGDRLRAAAPRLRGRDAQAVVGLLLAEDALAAREGAVASDRAARRLFDRLTMLGVVRELTGRPTFRLYGL